MYPVVEGKGQNLKITCNSKHQEIKAIDSFET
jgi:hypothetical protein